MTIFHLHQISPGIIQIIGGRLSTVLPRYDRLRNASGLTDYFEYGANFDCRSSAGQRYYTGGIWLMQKNPMINLAEIQVTDCSPKDTYIALQWHVTVIPSHARRSLPRRDTHSCLRFGRGAPINCHYWIDLRVAVALDRAAENRQWEYRPDTI